MTNIEVRPDDYESVVIRWRKRDGTMQKLHFKFTTVHTHDLLCVDVTGSGWSEALAYCNEHGSTK